MNARARSIIILHDYLDSADGGGRLCMLLADAFNADLTLGFRSKNHPYLEAYQPRTCFDLNAESSFPLLRQLKLSNKFRTSTQFVKSYSNAVYSGSYSPLAVLQNGARRNIMYCHTPPRFIYDKRDFYLEHYSGFRGLLLIQFINHLQPLYEAAIAQMDIIVANSHGVKQRIENYLGKSAEVIHPPCETRKFPWRGQQKYYLSTARLDKLKRVDLCIQAFLEMPDKTLLVTSDGPETRTLKKLAGNATNIHFTGQVSEARLRELIGNAIATIYLPMDEDFGMSPVESMAAGKPVIGVMEGGLLETVIHEETGLLLNSKPSIEQLISTVERMTPSFALSMRPDCELRARLFDSYQFIHKMNSVMDCTL